MCYIKKVFLSFLLINIVLFSYSQSDSDVYQLDDIIIRAEKEDEAKRFKVHVTEGFHGMPADTTQLLKKVPGANVNTNGPLTSFAQYRGMFGYRLNKSIDGIPLTSAGPNAMDPPLSYAPRLQLKTLEVYRGIAPVSAGIETLGGAVVATSNKGYFTDGSDLEFHGEVNGDGNSNNNGSAYNILSTISNDSHKFFLSGSREDGDDFEFEDGDILSTVHERKNLKLGYGLRTGDNEFGLDYSRVETERAGTPALPMDIWYFDGDLYNADYKISWGDIGISGNIYYTDIEHGMNNFSLRTTPAPSAIPPPLPINPFTAAGDLNQRFIIAESNAAGFTLKSTIAAGEGYFNLGIDSDLADHNATIFDPNMAAFRVESIDNAEKNRYGIFGEWHGNVQESWEVEFGVRYNQVRTDADDVSIVNPYIGQIPIAPAPGGLPAFVPGVITTNVGALVTRFNTSDRSQTDHNIDAVLKLDYEIDSNLTFEIGFGRKTRSPNFLERYLWIPLEINGGLSDGNNYIGDPNLDPEISHELDLGFDYTTDKYYLRPRVFYKDVDDYIQGIPVHESALTTVLAGPYGGPAPAVSTLNGDTTPLQYSNVDAEFVGFDVEMGVNLSDQWSLDGVLSAVQGNRTDINDDVYRVSPLNSIVALTHKRENWFASIEGVFYAAQNKVSKTNGEPKTSGYGLMNLRGQYNVNERVSVSGGVENVFDKKYTDHLAGVNRVIGNADIAVGEKLPGYGRSFYVSLNVSW